MDLLGSDSEEEQVEFKINESYAKNYEKWRKKEEHQKLKDRYGDADTSSSSEEEEIRSTPQMDKDWLRAYAVVRFNQPRLYKSGEKFFHEVAEPVVKKKEKPSTLKDHERKFILEKGGVESDDESKTQKPLGKSYFEEQEEIKKSLKEALPESSDEEEGDLLVKRQKTDEEKKKEENEFLEWLKGERVELEDKEAAAELAPLKAYWNDPNLSEKEKVLRDYILNNGYIEQEDSSEDESEEEEQKIFPDFRAEEEFLEKAEEYEQKYNFRHEEPGSDEIKSYPRVIETSVRTKDTRRADKRQKKLEKKKMEREKRKEEIRLLQKLQREEKREKLEKLRKIANNPKLDYDLEADFDPEEHNKIMQSYFNDDYYGVGDDDKPRFEYDAAVDEEPDNWWNERLQEEAKDEENTTEGGEDEGQSADDGQDYEPGPDDPDFVMDADYDPTRDYKAEKKKKKKKGKVVEKLPLFDPTKTTFDEYMDEYLKDKIDSLPFTYREVVPNDFGLSTEEILRAPERELNSWVSVKKMSQYRSKQEELSERRKFLARARMPEKKLKIIPSLAEKAEESKDAKDVTSKKTKKKKKKKKIKPVEGGEKTEQKKNEESSAQDGQKVLKRKRENSEVSSPDKVKPKKLKTGNEETKQNKVREKSSLDRNILKKKKKKKMQLSVESKKTKPAAPAKTTPQAPDKTKVKKKKKISLQLFKSGDKSAVGNKELKKQLSKVMSAARLSKYGIGPNAVKMKNKKKKKQKVAS
ncbi:protein KRI1 homolog [Physella acuta]|uniref:protein KRI1 homolog n=1 Tax=Physella acuta TaxID=109671 RepID=UPI0027DB34FC|nr:protein KRI1 homolog [Physella acuta]